MRKLLLALLLTAWAGAGWGADYYITNSGSGCSDAFGANATLCGGDGCGMCEANPKEFTDRAASNELEAISPAAGDTVYLERGYVYEGSNDNNAFNWVNGSDGTGWDAGQYILLTAFGTGDKPNLSAGWSIPTSGWTADGSNYYYDITSYNPDDADAANRHKVWIDGTALEPVGAAPTGVGEWWVDTVNDRLYVRTYEDDNPSAHATIYFGQARAVMYTNDAYRKFVDVRFSHGGRPTTSAVSGWDAAGHWWVDSCEIGPSANGVGLIFADSRVTNSYIHDIWDGEDYGAAGNSFCIGLYEGAADAAVASHNYLENCYLGVFSAGGSGGIDGATITFNVFDSAYVNGIDLSTGPGGTAVGDVLVANNTIYHNPGVPTDDDIRGHALKFDGQDYVDVRNNAIYVAQSADPGTPGDYINALQINSELGANSIVDYNLYYIQDITTYSSVYYYASYLTGTPVHHNTKTSWTTEMDETTNMVGFDANAVFVAEGTLSIDAPSYADATSLVGIQPAINAGLDVCSTLDGDQYDLAGEQVCASGAVTGAWTNGVEIGAYGYTATGGGGIIGGGLIPGMFGMSGGGGGAAASPVYLAWGSDILYWGSDALHWGTE